MLETTLFKSSSRHLVNGEVNEFYVRSHFTLSEDPDETEHFVDSQSKSLSTYKNPDAVSNIVKSGLDDQSVVLTWTSNICFVEWTLTI